MEDFLPVLIGIVWLVYTLYNRSQKKKNAGRPQQTEKKESSTPSFIEQLLMGDKPAQPLPYEEFDETEPEKIEFEEEFPIKEKQTPFLKKELADFIYEGQSATYDESIVEETTTEIHSEIETEANDFDLRKAVIYSEILNTPYIVYK